MCSLRTDNRVTYSTTQGVKLPIGLPKPPQNQIAKIICLGVGMKSVKNNQFTLNRMFK